MGTLRRFISGMVVGLILGLASASSASYVGTGTWQQFPNGELFHLGYVAGIIDTVETLKGASFFSRQRIEEALDSIRKCTASSTLGTVTARAENAVANGATYPIAANVIMADLLKCQ